MTMDGAVQFVALPPGDYTLGITAQGHEPISQAITLVEGDNQAAALLGVDGPVIKLTPVLEDRVTMRGRKLLDGVDDGGHSNIQVLAYVQGNLVATT